MPREFESIQYTVENGVAEVRFERPQALNAWTRSMGLEIRDALDGAIEDRGVRVIAITGAGRAFSAGADLTDPPPRTTEGLPDLGSGLRELYNPMILAVREAPKPVVAVVNGVAAGFSVSLAVACDLIIAAESAYFLLAFSRVGLGPDGGASLTIPARIGFGRALELSLLADRLHATDALRWGLINAVHPDAELGTASAALTRRLADGPVGSFAAIKRLHNLPLLPQLRDQLAQEATEQFQRGLSADYAEGVSAFVNKRQPQFADVAD
jgi:2-(1,2-epoxy-1,2-dihydrophenyl)acetyl-CoA isomerase